MTGPKTTWYELLARADFDALAEELSGDPYDLQAGDIVVNRGREARVFLESYPTHAGQPGVDSGMRYHWLDPITGRVHDDSWQRWADWSGECLWFLTTDAAGSWCFRSPFADAIIRDGAE